MKKYRQTGLTLTELMMAITLLAVLIAMAGPSLVNINKNSRIRSQINDFHLALLTARSEAITRISRVAVCPSSNGTSCAGAGPWDQGWIIFTDGAPLLGTVDGTDVILRYQEALVGDTNLLGSPNVVSYISYIGNGQAMEADSTLQDGTVSLCDDRGESDGRAIVIQPAGRPGVIDTTAATTPTDCTPTA